MRDTKVHDKHLHVKNVYPKEVNTNNDEMINKVNELVKLNLIFEDSTECVNVFMNK